MKKFIFIFLVVFVTPLFSIFAQINKENPESNEINFVTLTQAKNKEYLDTLHSVCNKIINMPKKDRWTFRNGDAMGTNAKTIDGKIYTITVDNHSRFDDGSTISQIVVYILTKDSKKDNYPIEVLTFNYDHQKKRGMVIWYEKYSKWDDETHHKDSTQIKTRIEEIMKRLTTEIL